MSRRSTPCTQADLTRLLKAVLAAGVPMERIAGVKLTREGAMVLFGEQGLNQTDPVNEWDEVLE